MVNWRRFFSSKIIFTIYKFYDIVDTKIELCGLFADDTSTSARWAYDNNILRNKHGSFDIFIIVIYSSLRMYIFKSKLRF